MLSLVASAAVIAAVICTATLLVLGALGAAALLPRGAPLTDALRQFAGEMPRFIWRVVRWLDGMVFVAAVVLAAVLALVLS